MVRSVRSRPVAISTGRTSAARSVRWSAATGSARPASGRRAAITRPALGAIASRAGRSLSFLLVSLPAYHHAPSADHCAVDSGDDAGRISVGDFNQSMAFAEVDLANVIAGNSAFASDRAHQIADLHAIARSDSHEKTCHPARCALGSITIRRSRPRDRDGILGGRAPLGTLALEHIKRGGRELHRIKLLQQGLQGDDLTRRNAPVQHGPQLLSHSFLTIMRAALGPAEVERRATPAGQFPWPGDLTGSGQHHDLNRFCLSNALKLRRRNRGLIKNHRMAGRCEIALSDADVRVVIVVAERAESL